MTSTERIVRVSDAIELCCEEHGSPADPLVLLVMGLGLDLCWWRDDFVAGLVARGLRVLRFDNRDVGRSTHVQGPGVSGWQFLRRRAKPTYSLEAMADDAAALLGTVAPDRKACVVGASMGAMIAQQLAIRHPDRVGSLVSIMGRPGDRRSGKVALRMFPQFLWPASGDPAEQLVQSFRRIGSVGRTDLDDEDVRVTFRRAARREQGDGLGAGRQLAAIIAESDRTPGLTRLQIPATVIHGRRDRVIVPSGGRATAAAIPGAELLEIDGMGHDLPRWVWPQVQDVIAQAVRGSSR